MKTRGYRSKRHSCALCKPHKMGWNHKDKPKYREREKRDQAEVHEPPVDSPLVAVRASIVADSREEDRWPW